MSWHTALAWLFGAIIAFSALALIVDQILERRRTAKEFRINPLFYAVGRDCKDR